MRPNPNDEYWRDHDIDVRLEEGTPDHGKVRAALRMIEGEIAAGGEYAVAEERAAAALGMSPAEVDRAREEYDSR